MMMCPTKDKQSAEILLEYCAGTLDPDRALEFEKHAAECAECGRQVASQRALWQTLDQWTPAEMSPDFDARLYARIAREEAAPLWKKWFVRGWKPALVTAAAGAAIVIGLFVRQPQPPSRTDIVDIDQVEHALEDLDMLTPLPAAGNRI
jgi:anti-sigma factor RsiW